MHFFQPSFYLVKNKAVFLTGSPSRTETVPQDKLIEISFLSDMLLFTRRLLKLKVHWPGLLLRR